MRGVWVDRVGDRWKQRECVRRRVERYAILGQRDRVLLPESGPTSPQQQRTALLAEREGTCSRAPGSGVDARPHVRVQVVSRGDASAVPREDGVPYELRVLESEEHALRLRIDQAPVIPGRIVFVHGQLPPARGRGAFGALCNEDDEPIAPP